MNAPHNNVPVTLVGAQLFRELMREEENGCGLPPMLPQEQLNQLYPLEVIDRLQKPALR